MHDDTNTATVQADSNGTPARPRNVKAYRPDVDVYESEREVLLVVDLPGARAEAIDVRCENGTLTLAAKVEPRDAEGRRYLLREYGVGDFYRSFHLADSIDASRISGDFADGVLALHLPKVAAAQPTRVAIRSA